LPDFTSFPPRSGERTREDAEPRSIVADYLRATGSTNASKVQAIKASMTINPQKIGCGETVRLCSLWLQRVRSASWVPNFCV